MGSQPWLSQPPRLQSALAGEPGRRAEIAIHQEQRLSVVFTEVEGLRGALLVPCAIDLAPIAHP